MSKSIRGTTKSRRAPRGRPRTTGKGEQIGMRWQASQLEAIDAWRAEQEDKHSRPEAIRRLVELGLAAGRTIPLIRASEAAPKPAPAPRRRR